MPPSLAVKKLGAALPPLDGAVGRTKRVADAVLAVATLGIGVAVPLAVLLSLAASGRDAGTELYFAALAVVLVDLALLISRGIAALRPPPAPRTPRTAYPPAGAIVLAEMDSTPELIVQTTGALLDSPYPAPLEIAVVGADTRDLEAAGIFAPAQGSSRTLVPITVPVGNRARWVQTGLERLSGEFVAIFHAGQVPRRDAFTRAWLWLSNGCEIVQGSRSISNGEESWLAAWAAIEAETPEWIPHPIGASNAGGLPWCEGNTYLLTSLARGLMTGTVEPERRSGLLSRRSPRGHPVGRPTRRGGPPTPPRAGATRLAPTGAMLLATDVRFYPGVDCRLSSREPAPSTLGAWWDERMRRELACLRIPARRIWGPLAPSLLSRGRRLALVDLLVWRPAYAWLSLQVLTVIAYRAWRHVSDNVEISVVPLVVLAALYLVGASLLKSLFALRLAPAEIRRHQRWFFQYAFLYAPFVAGLEGTIARVAQLRSILGPNGAPLPVQERRWEGWGQGRSGGPGVPSGSPRGWLGERPAEPATPRGDTGGPPLGAAPTGEMSTMRVLTPRSTEPESTLGLSPPYWSPDIGGSSLRGILGAVRRMTGVVDEIVRQIDAGEMEEGRLRARIRSLEARTARSDSIRCAQHTLARHPVEGDVEAVLAMLAALREKPGRISVLASIPSHAATLARVLAAYTELSDVLAGEMREERRVVDESVHLTAE